jgi:outer membrane protein OmpA-like peptidoglycan-associated protein
VVDQQGGRVVIDLGGGRVYVQTTVPDEGDRLLYGADNVEVQHLPHGQTRTVLHRRDGDVVTIRDRYGNIVKRSRYLPNGREIVLIDNRYPDSAYANGWQPPILDVPPPRITIPRDRYVVDLGEADDQQIRAALLAPPVAPPPRRYTLDEVLYNNNVREYSPRIDLDTITFDFGSATIGIDQMPALQNLGTVMEQVIAQNPDEVYLVEGHTDAVGSDNDNLILSDERAEAVATALSQNFDIPPENLVTQGYGEQYLKVNTQAPERQNRRATIRRLTELLQSAGQ